MVQVNNLSVKSAPAISAAKQVMRIVIIMVISHITWLRKPLIPGIVSFFYMLGVIFLGMSLKIVELT